MGEKRETRQVQARRASHPPRQGASRPTAPALRGELAPARTRQQPRPGLRAPGGRPRTRLSRAEAGCGAADAPRRAGRRRGQRRRASCAVEQASRYCVSLPWSAARTRDCAWRTGCLHGMAQGHMRVVVILVMESEVLQYLTLPVPVLECTCACLESGCAHACRDPKPQTLIPTP